MYNKLKIKHLENFSSSEGYWSTTDCVGVAKHILEITNASSMLEIGFNIGYSASIWLSCGIKDLYIIDINTHTDTEEAIKATVEEYKDKNIYSLLVDSTSDEAKDWVIPEVDIAFIDGGHTYKDVFEELRFVRNLQKKGDVIIVDDVLSNKFKSVQFALDDFLTNSPYSIRYISCGNSRYLAILFRY